MNIKNEIERERQQIVAAEKAKQIAHLQFVQEAKMIIPDFVNRFKRSAISQAASGNNIVKRGFFHKKTYVVTRINGSFFNPYQKRMIANTPEIDKDIITALSAQGFENISITRTDNYKYAIYISAWLDIT